MGFKQFLSKQDVCLHPMQRGTTVLPVFQDCRSKQWIVMFLAFCMDDTQGDSRSKREEGRKKKEEDWR